MKVVSMERKQKRKCTRCKADFESEENDAYCPQCDDLLQEQTFQYMRTCG